MVSIGIADNITVVYTKNCGSLERIRSREKQCRVSHLVIEINEGALGRNKGLKSIMDKSRSIKSSSQKPNIQKVHPISSIHLSITSNHLKMVHMFKENLHFNRLIKNQEKTNKPQGEDMRESTRANVEAKIHQFSSRIQPHIST